MKPKNLDNFLIEVTSDQLEHLKSLYFLDDNPGYEEMHYSPYWILSKNPTYIGVDIAKKGADKSVKTINCPCGGYCGK